MKEDENGNIILSHKEGQDYFELKNRINNSEKLLSLERDRNALLRRENVKLWKDIDLLQRSLEVARKACATHQSLIALLEESMSQTCEECGVKTAVPYMHKGLCPRCAGKAHEAVVGEGKESA